MVIPVGYQIMGQEIFRITRTEEGFEEERLLMVRFVPLVDGLPSEK